MEVGAAVYDEITQVIYDPKFHFVTPTHEDATRTFCTNPGGWVCLEESEGFRLVNGHAFRHRRTASTNFALLNTVTMTEPLQDNTEMGRKVAEFANFWGGGESLIVQRWGDLMEGTSLPDRDLHLVAAGLRRHGADASAGAERDPG